jgi:tetratricopeptide (TPR) repeat protein
MRKFIARNKGVSIAATVTFVAVLAAAIVSMLEARAADKQRDRALALAERNAGINEFLTYLITDAASSDKPITISEMLARSEKLAAAENHVDPETQAAVLDVVSTQYHSLGDDVRAEPIARQAMDLARKSADASLQARIAGNHAMTLAGLGKVDEARSILNGLAADPKADPENSAGALEMLAYIAQDQLDAPAALAYSQRALAKLQQAPGVRRDDEAVYLGTLGLSLNLVERNVESDEKFKQSLDIYAETGHAGRSDAISVRNNWGISKQTAGDPKQALALFEQTRQQLAASDPTLPPPNYLMGNLARAQESIGRYADAERTNRACVDAAQKSKDEAHVAYCSFGLAIDALEQGRVVDAERYRDQGVKSAATLETMIRPLFFAQQLALGRIALRENRLDIAREAFEAVIGTGDNFKVPFLALIGLASVDLAQGDCTDAEKRARRALQIAVARAGGEPYSFASGYAWLTLARMAALRNNDTEARAAAQSAVTQLTNTVDESLPALQVAQALAQGAGVPASADEMSGAVAAKACRDL